LPRGVLGSSRYSSLDWLDANFLWVWSSEWIVVHQHLVLTSPVLNVEDQKSHHKHQDQWLGKVASFVMHQVHQLYILRNHKHHGVTLVECEARLRTTAERGTRSSVCQQSGLLRTLPSSHLLYQYISQQAKTAPQTL
jgi:hypothetical protein